MGVAGLWDVIRPAGKVRSLTELSVMEGFVANPDGVRGFRVGIDASIWFFHAEYGREGENPVLRTLFFRCATLMHSPFLPLFVFDGPKRPEWKRGKKINRAGHKLIPGMKAIVESFGFEWRMAPGEAEAELAYLNRIGVIDGILSDDVDNFLFGATTVIRNPSNNLSGNKSNPALNAAGKDDKNHTMVYRMPDITAHSDVQLTRGGMILIGLMSGGDYQQGGLNRCGTVTAHGLAKCGFGDTLFQAANDMTREQLGTFLVAWRHELCQELRTNSQGHIGRKQRSLANSIPSDFPVIDILLSYTNPITSESMGRAENNLRLTWSKEPDLGRLAATCEFYFEWGYREAIIKRFRTVVWHSAVLRILRRAVLDLDEKAKVGRVLPPITPRKPNKAVREHIGTPSKMITKHFSSMNLGDQSDSDNDDEGGLIIKIHSEREHVSTDRILEYRLEIAPGQLVRIAESGILGTRSAEGPDEWDDDEDDEEVGKGTKKPPPDPQSHMRVWMPACMVRLVEPHLVEEYEAVQEKKRQKKAGKGRGKAKTRASFADEDNPGSDNSLKPKPKRTAPKPKNKLPPPKIAEDESEPDVRQSLDPTKKRKPTNPTGTKINSFPTLGDNLEPELLRASEPSGPIIRDLTKKKVPNNPVGTNIKSFFKTTKPSNNIRQKTPPAVLSKIDTSYKTRRIVQEEEASSSEDEPTSSKRVDHTHVPRKASEKISFELNRYPSAKAPLEDLSPSGLRPLVRDFTKKKVASSIGNGRHPPLFVPGNLGHISSGEDSDTALQLGGLLVSPIKPNPLTTWKKPSTTVYVDVSDSDDNANSKLKSALTSYADDSHMFDSDVPIEHSQPTSKMFPSKLKPVRKEKPSSTSESESSRRHLNKSPRKTSEHTSPRKQPSHSRNSRPVSPSPVKGPTQLDKRLYPPSDTQLPAIEVSDSDDEFPIDPRLPVPPLLLARARVVAKSGSMPVTQTSMNDFIKPVVRTATMKSTNIMNDIIDLT